MEGGMAFMVMLCYVPVVLGTWGLFLGTRPPKNCYEDPEVAGSVAFFERDGACGV